MIPFTKANACGNDFLIVTQDAAAGYDWADLTRSLCARNTGIGADGVEFFAWNDIGASSNSGRIRLHNADGSVAEISGNGTRCVAAWMAEALGSKPGDELEIVTDAGLRVCRVNAVDTSSGFTVEVSTGMGTPTFAPRTVNLADCVWVNGVEVSTGNPHFVIAVNDAEFTSNYGYDWQTLGAGVCRHQDFPHQTNVEFVRIVSEHEIEIRIWERGVGATSSSGTGSSAAATAAIALHGCKSPLTVVASGGAQTVLWDGPGTELTLIGPANLIARGETFYK